MSRLSFARPKIQSAKRFLSLQVSQASHVISDELSNILKSKCSAGKKRRKIIEEIFSTEQSYQEHLQLVTSLFLTPLRRRNILPDHVVGLIFSNIEAIQNVNRELLTHMETMGLGDAFLALAPFLKLYSTYANNFEKAMNTIKDWEKKSPKFCSFKAQQEELEEARGLKLNALLITPIQRVPRYKMLLENLLWKTAEDHADFNKLKEAVDQISKIAIHINENIRQHENFQKMLSIQNSFSREGAPKIMAPGRIFLKEGTLLKVGKRGWAGASKERTFFLFSDILIYSKKNHVREKDSARSYVCLSVFPLIHCKVQEVMGDGNTSEGGALFSIECQDKSLLLFSKSQGEAKSWLNEIRTAIDNLHNSRSSQLRRSTRSGQSSKKRRAPVRKPNQLKSDNMMNLNCLSPRKGKRLLALTEVSSEDLLENGVVECNENAGCIVSEEGQSFDEGNDSESSLIEGSQDLMREEEKVSGCSLVGTSVDLSTEEKENVGEENTHRQVVEEKSAHDEDCNLEMQEDIPMKRTAGVKRKLSNCDFSENLLPAARALPKRRNTRLRMLGCGSNIQTT